MWRIRKTRDKGRYLQALVPEHPRSNKDGWIAMHSVVAENKIGRLLRADEVVHHRDEDKKNNRPGNLRVEVRGPHTAHHTRVGVSWVRLRCPACRAIFDRERRHTHLGRPGRTFTACSSSCRASLTREIQCFGELTREQRRANIVKEYIR